MNDKARMSNETLTHGISAFVIPISFVIRHLSFVIVAS